MDGKNIILDMSYFFIINYECSNNYLYTNYMCTETKT